ncbi:uncharacterized protein LOC110414744 isoform X3 [Herrania umbratica]|uniref:Uncharacterized protein LOC110414744 isoform X3 n=1 Tax=Herrania umbratica TaxID=108875 RepID=A0A6J1A488_9ROSI|nr:uncharacterized protein LOC110414744 isoform X3 [Herrania umbratica]
MEAAIATGGAGNLVAEVVKYIAPQFKRPISYIFLHRRKVENFEEKVEMLTERRERVQNAVDVAERNMEIIEKDVQNWLIRVNRIINEEVKDVKDLEDKAKSKCFVGLCPNFRSRYLLSKKAGEGSNTIDELLRQGEFNRVSFPAAPPDIVAASAKEFEAFDSRKNVFDEIVEALKDASINLVGVYGMGGVGKTTLVKEVARQVKEDKLFDSVVMAAVTQTPDIQKIQNQIADILGLKFDEQSMTGRACRLSERLKKEKKILVVLDDIWARLDLEEVGIPLGDQQKGCKILLTSRDQDVLFNGMDAKKTFAIGVLEESEAWDLFKKMAGDSVENLELRSTAIKVAQKCAGLPVAITTVARSLRSKGLFAWNDALRKLQRPSPTNFTGIPAHVYSAIELSYSHLESEELKQTFLLCSLLGHHVAIQDLLKFTMGLGLLNGVGTVEEARDRLLTLVSNLKTSCLLLDSFTCDRFDMHDLISDVALAIASRNNHVFVLKNEDVLKDWPDEDTMKMCSSISLCYASINELPDELKCPQLAFFHMGSKDASVRIPANFFKETKDLKVLDLTDMHLPSLPSSIFLLTNLRTLCLDFCALGDIAIIGELKDLKVLSLIGSDIERLPREIARLTQLRLLDLHDCTKLKVIPPNVLSSLSRLEELYMGNSFVQWEVEGHANQRSNASLAELKSLSRLTTLEVHIPDAKIMPRDLFFEKLERYNIFLGDKWNWFDTNEYSRTLNLQLDSGIDDLDLGTKMLLKKTEDLHLHEMKGVKVGLNELEDGEGFPHLKNLHIQNGLEIRYIINDDDAVDKVEFLQLRSLTLQDLPQLISFCSGNRRGLTSISPLEFPLFNEKVVFPCLENLRLSSINVEQIWHNQLSEISYCIQNLTSLIIEGCGKLKRLLSSSMIRSLEHLKSFEISDCKCLREIIFTEDIEEENNSMVLFPRLNSLKIKSMQHLIGFCSENHSIEFPSLKLLEIEHCPQFKGFMYKSTMEDNQRCSTQALFDETVAFPSLEKMTISHLRNMKMIWHSQLFASSFCKLEEMRVEHCNELLTVFPSNILGTFQQLRTLKISSCGSLEEVFDLQRLNMEEAQVVTTQLRELDIVHLPKLKQIWNNDPQGILTFQNLCIVYVWDCWNLKTVFPPSVASVLPQLKDLKIYSSGVEEIVSKEEGSEVAITFEFHQVSSLVLWNLPKLKCFYPGKHTTKWPTLKKLITYHCNDIMILSTEQRNMQEMNGGYQLESPIQPPLFLVEKVIPKLKELSLNCDDITMMCDSQFSRSLFPGVEVLKLLCYHDENAIFPISFVERFQNLERLEVVCCKFKEIFSSEGDIGLERRAGTLSQVRTLKLDGLDNLLHIWKQDSRLDHILLNLETLEVHNCRGLIGLGLSQSSFQNLKTLDVWQCNAMINLVTSLAVQSLVRLEKMSIRECLSMKEIVGDPGDEETYDIVFSNLKCLELQHLPNLTSFCSGNHTFEFPSLEQVIVTQCPELKIFCHGVLNVPLLRRVQKTNEDDKGPWVGDLNSTVQQLYTEQVGFQGMEYCVLSEFSKSMEIWNENLPGVLDFKNLKSLEVYGCNRLKYIFTFSMALDLQQLKEIKVKDCLMMEHIITHDGEEAATLTIMLPWLQFVTLESCSNLTSFYSGINTLECPSLKEIILVDCPKTFAFASTISREQGPEKFDRGNMKRNGKGIPNDTVAPFFSDKVLCPHLEYVRLCSIKIQKIWHDQLQVTSSNLQNLKTLIVEGCHSLKYLFLPAMAKAFLQLRDLYIINCQNVEEVIIVEGLTETERISQMFFPKLELLELRGLPKLVRFCHGNYFVFPFLRTLWITDCPELNTLISDSLIGGQPQMAQKEEGNKSEVDTLSFFNEKVAFPRIKELRITGMGNWRKIWQDKLTVDSFCELNFLLVKNCERLLNIFPFDMMERLDKLKELHIWNCASLEEIIGAHELNSYESHVINATQSTIMFVLPKVTFLGLSTLPKLKCFYSKIHTTEWPSLIELQVIGCSKVKIFAGEYLNLQEVQRESQLEISTQQPLFWVSKDTFPNLEVLILEQNDIMKEIWLGQLPTQYFSKLRALELISFPYNAVTVPDCFIQSLPNLAKLVVSEASFNEIFQCEGHEGVGEHAKALALLSELRLSELPELTCLWKEETPLGDAFYNLRTLEVMGCGRLKNLVPSSVYFENLTTLEVSKCHGFITLIALPTAKSMVHLARMSITDCPMMEEVVACASEVRDGIIFSQLKYLELGSLPSLSSFCSGNCSFLFPSLENVTVRHCSNMKIFSQGELSTPNMQRVQFAEDEERWDGNLNTTMEQIFIQMNVSNSKEEEGCSSHPKFNQGKYFPSQRQCI